MSKNTLLTFGNAKSEYLLDLKKNYEVRNVDLQSRNVDENFSSEKVSAIFIDGSDLSNETFSLKVKSTIDQMGSVTLILAKCNALNLSKLIGIGFDSELALVKILDDNNVSVEILEPSRELIKFDEGQKTDDYNYISEFEKELRKKIDEVVKNAKMQAESETDSESLSKEEDEYFQKLKAFENPVNLEVDADTRRQALNKRIKELLDKEQSDGAKTRTSQRPHINIPSEMPKTSWKNYAVGTGHFEYVVSGVNGKVQTAFIGIEFEVLLIALNRPMQEGKYCIIKQTGAGLSPGRMCHDSPYTRMYYQVFGELCYGPTERQEGLVILKNAPANQNNVTTTTTTTGFTISGGVGADGPNFGFSYENSQTVQTTVNDFEIINSSTTNLFTCTYTLSPGKVQLHPIGLLRWPKISEVPTLSKNTFPVSSECIWKAPSDFNKQVNYGFRVRHELNGIHVAGIYDVRMFPKRHEVAKNIEIDFSVVSIQQV